MLFLNNAAGSQCSVRNNERVPWGEAKNERFLPGARYSAAAEKKLNEGDI